MSNLISNNYNNLRIFLNNDEYWDYFLCKDSFLSDSIFKSSDADTNGCLISYIDLTNEKYVNENWVKSADEYTWENAIVNPYTFNNIGYTGLDNGLIPFRRDTIGNKDFIEIFQNSKYSSTDTTPILRLHKVSGGTRFITYDCDFSGEDYVFKGGWLQGIFETKCDEYAILPSKLNNEWNLEFELKKENFDTDKETMNSLYPENKGIFFYIGTRAENKWVYYYNKLWNGDKSTIKTTTFNHNVTTKTREDKPQETIDGNSTYEYSDEYINETINNLEEDFSLKGGVITIDFPEIDEKSFFMSDYLSFKYYDDELYNPPCLEDNDFFNAEYIDINVEPKIIDEKNTKFKKYLHWCCNKECECNDYEEKECDTELEEILRETPKGWLNSCELFDEVDIQDGELLYDDYDYIESEINIEDFIYTTDSGFKLDISKQYKILTNNKFLLFNRTCTGFTVNTWVDNTFVEFQGVKHNFKENLFLLMNRTCTGYTVDTLQETREKTLSEYNIYKDLYNNALAFRIKDDGSIGYRYCALDCNSETKCSIIEAYSKPNIINPNEWYKINIKIVPYITTMKIFFYVNGKLKFISTELPKLDLRKLNELDEKQESVPYNISLGGGTQGLYETILFDYYKTPNRIYPLEENFGGSFIGRIKYFKFYNCELNYTQILNNFNKKINIYN